MPAIKWANVFLQVKSHAMSVSNMYQLVMESGFAAFGAVQRFVTGQYQKFPLKSKSLLLYFDFNKYLYTIIVFVLELNYCYFENALSVNNLSKEISVFLGNLSKNISQISAKKILVFSVNWWISRIGQDRPSNNNLFIFLPLYIPNRQEFHDGSSFWV